MNFKNTPDSPPPTIISVTWSSGGGIRENMGLVDFVLGEAQPSPNTKLTTHIFPYPTPRRLHVTDLSYPYRQFYK